MNFYYENIIFTSLFWSQSRCPSQLLRSFHCRFRRLLIVFYLRWCIGWNCRLGSSGFIGIFRNRWKLLGFSVCSRPLFLSFSIQHVIIRCPLFLSLHHPRRNFSFGFSIYYSEFYWNPRNHWAEIPTVCWFW